MKIFTTDFNPLDLKDVVDSGMSAILEGIQREVQNGIKRSINKASPPSSKAGQNPRKRTGNLGRSVLLTKIVDSNGLLFGTVHVDAPYARPLEFGAKLPGGQPYFYNAKEGKIVYVRKSHPNAAKFKKTKPGFLKPRPFVIRQVNKTKKRIPLHMRKFVRTFKSMAKPGRMRTLT